MINKINDRYSIKKKAKLRKKVAVLRLNSIIVGCKQIRPPIREGHFSEGEPLGGGDRLTKIEGGG